MRAPKAASITCVGELSEAVQHLGFETVDLVDLGDAVDQVHAGPADIVQSAHEGSHDVSAGLGGQ